MTFVVISEPAVEFACGLSKIGTPATCCPIVVSRKRIWSDVRYFGRCWLEIAKPSPPATIVSMTMSSQWSRRNRT